MARNSKPRADHEGSVFYREDKKVWVAAITLGYDPKTGRRVKKQRYAKTQKEALKKLKELQELYAHSIHFDADTITVDQWFDQWFDVYKKPKLRENTQVSYKKVMKYCTDAIGYMKLDKVRPADLQYIIYHKIGKEKYRTCKYFVTVIKQIFARAVQEHLIIESPAAHLELPAKPAPAEYVEVTNEIWTKLLEAKCGFYGWVMAILTVLVTGMRRSEFLALTWDSFQIDRDENGNITGGMVTIDKAMGVGDVDPVTKHKTIYIDKTKSINSVRKLRLPASYCRELMNYRKIQAEKRLASRTWEHPEMVFTTNDGRYYNPDVFSSLFSKICKEKQLPISLHKLRHDFATSMKSSHNFDFKDIQHQLGHSNIQITLDTYTHMEEKELEKIDDFVDERFALVVGKKKK